MDVVTQANIVIICYVIIGIIIGIVAQIYKFSHEKIFKISILCIIPFDLILMKLIFSYPQWVYYSIISIIFTGLMMYFCEFLYKRYSK